MIVSHFRNINFVKIFQQNKRSKIILINKGRTRNKIKRLNIQINRQYINIKENFHKFLIVNNCTLLVSYYLYVTYKTPTKFYSDQYFTYNVVRPRIRFNASPGTTVRPQLCNDKRFNLCKPMNASESIFDIVLSDSTLKNENAFD